MIAGYADHSANERTFLAWIRTGIAIIAFGFLIEKFNLFMLTLASAALGNQGHHLPVAALLGRIGHYDGLIMMVGGVGVVALATARFVRTTRMLDDAKPHSAKSVRLELILCGFLVLLVSSYSLYLILG